jgi:hypothetical protein
MEHKPGFLIEYADSHAYDALAFPSLQRVSGMCDLEFHMRHVEMFLLLPTHKQKVK